MTLKPVELHKAYRLINHGPTVMVSAEFDGVRDVMSASWVCPLDYDKLTAVIGASSFTRSLLKRAANLPCRCLSSRRRNSSPRWARQVCEGARASLRAWRCFTSGTCR